MERTIVKFVVFLLFCSLCFSCTDRGSALRGGELCEQMQEAVLHYGHSGEKIDSLVALSAGISPAGRYAVLFHAVQHCLNLSDQKRAMYYLQLLDSLPFPELQDKEVGFLLLNCYDVMGDNFLSFAPRQVDPKQIASLLFDMENRWKLSPEEKLRFLILKSGIYFNVFKEYKSAVIIVKDGIVLARQCGASQETMMGLFRVLFQSSLRLGEEEQLMSLADDFIKLAESCSFDSVAKKTVYNTIGMLYERQGDYRKAYHCLNRTGKKDTGLYKGLLTRLYVELDSLPAAQAYVEKMRKKNPHPLMLANMVWDEARIRRMMGDSVGYERSLQESVQLFDRFPGYEVDGCAPSEAYARMLWQQGKRREAICRMELVNQKLVAKTDYAKQVFTAVSDLSSWMSRFRLLRDYYKEEGRTQEALQQSMLCDSIEQQFAKARLQAEQRKTTTAAYTMDLVHNLDLRAIEFQQGERKLYAAYFVLGLTLLGAVALLILYRQREQQLNVLYARQKEIELLQAAKSSQAKVEQLSSEEQLFLELERKFYQEELFRNPGYSRDDLCRLGGSNRMYVSTCINKYAGTNINQWINRARIDYAIRLIHKGEDDLIQLSSQSGFASDKSFLRSFKQFTNLTPRQYIVRERAGG